MHLGKRHRKALAALRTECALDPVNYFHIPHIVTGVGSGTIADLETLGLIEAGHHSVTKHPGHRTTPKGEETHRAILTTGARFGTDSDT